MSTTRLLAGVELPAPDVWRIDPGDTSRDDHQLTIKDITRPVDLAVENLGHAADPSGADRAAFTARARINPEEWGLRWSMVREAGGLLVSKEITLEIEVELIRQPS